MAVIIGTNGPDNLVGTSASDVIIGLGGGDIIDGGDTNANELYGGLGDDIFIVRVAGDTIVEFANEGTDTVQTALSFYALRDNLENLTFTGTGDFTGVGNTADNVITGGAGNDFLTGGAGNNTLNGGAGIDWAVYETAPAGVVIDLSIPSHHATNGYGGTDTLNGIENVIGSAFVDTLVGDSGNNALYGNGGNDVLDGNGGNDFLAGGAGDDLLEQASGVATMAGGTGDDSYVVTNAADVIVENAGEGTDLVYDRVINFVLAANVENAQIEFIGGTLTGNDADNVVTGSTGNDTIAGLGGHNTLSGGAGIDTLDYGAAPAGVHVDLNDNVVSANGYGATDSISGFEDVNGSASDDVLVGSSGNNVLVGGLGRDTLVGLAGDDALDGGTGAANELQGGTGDDSYDVRAVGDSVIEFAGEGNDRVFAFVSAYTLPANVEQLFAGSAAGLTGIGNSADNQITGSTGSDYLIGLGGNDTLSGGTGAANTLQGGTGDDTYVVAAAGDSIIEFAGEGFDTVQSQLNSFTLPANVEKLTFVGTGNFNGTGNSGDNVFVGGESSDTFTGAGGSDTFVCSPGVGHHYTITDFDANNASPGHDHLDFTGQGLTLSNLTVQSFATTDTMITVIPTGSTIHLIGVTPDQIDTGDFFF